MRATFTATLLFALVALSACGGSSGSQTADDPQTTAQSNTVTTPSARARAGDLLDDWSDQLLVTLLAARDRGKAAQAGDRAAMVGADTKLRPELAKVKKFASQGRAVMSQFDDRELRETVVADGDAWQGWALALDQPGGVTRDRARKIADLATDAFVAHERAYAMAGWTPPVAFQRRPDQR
jgi:hypothetical protein